ncbi:MAG: Stp1/IreP family PP2C-type Ser/Thr phosphatase [Thermoanaerobaculia bacterium]
MSIRLQAWGLSDVGRQRARNEDSYSIDPERKLYLVADGMGGHGNGDVASRLVVEAVERYFREPANGGRPPDPDSATERLREAVGSAQGSLRSAMDEDTSLSGMGTTLVGILALEESAVVVHVGDSRAYRWRDGRLERLTRDHSWVDEQVAAGYLSEDQARSHPLKSVVTRALSGDGGVEVDARTLSLRPGDRYLICTDGLTTMLADQDIEARLARDGSLEAICRDLVDQCNARGGLDNITVVMLSVEARR